MLRKENAAMTITIELSDRLAEPLNAEAMAQGVSPDRYVSAIVEHALSADAPRDTVALDARPISIVIAEIMKDVPAEEMAKLPRDGASQVDHYVYGLPKRD